jgi:hypothetical protein
VLATRRAKRKIIVFNADESYSSAAQVSRLFAVNEIVCYNFLVNKNNEKL